MNTESVPVFAYSGQVARFDGPNRGSDTRCMTPVRQESPTAAGGKARKPAKGATTQRRVEAGAAGKPKKPTAARPGRKTGKSSASGTKVAQVRLQPEEVAALEAVVQRLNLSSTSEALREGLRLLVREAAETQAAEEIRTFYGDERVPLPAGVAPATEAELKAADEDLW